jgi:hypothetical protein
VNGGIMDYLPELIVVDPLRTKSRTYEISVAESLFVYGWKLKDKATGELLHTSSNFGSTTRRDPNDDFAHPIIDGVLWNVSARAPSFVIDSTTATDKTYTHWITQPPQIQDGGYYGRSGAPSYGGMIEFGEELGGGYFSSITTTIPAAATYPVLLKFGPGNGQKAYRLARTGPGSSYQLQTTVKTAAPAGEPFVNFPFSAWDVRDANHPRQITLTWRDQDQNALWTPGTITANLEYAMILDLPYDSLGRQFTYPANPLKAGPVIGDEATVNVPILYFVSLRGTTAPPTGTAESISPGSFLIRPLLGYRPGVTLEIPINGPTITSSLIRADALNRVNVFPNPFYGINSNANDGRRRTVTFSNLPVKATIRIFNLAGQLVRVLWKDDAGQYLEWNLMNEHGRFVGSGMYLALVEMPDLGISKTLKLAVLQAEEW